MMTEEDHKSRHNFLHEMLDELAADFIASTGKRLGETSILELIQWSHQQTISPVKVLFQNHMVNPK